MYATLPLSLFHLSLLFSSALQHAGKHMEDSIVASYTALLLGCLCQGSPVRTHTHTRSSVAWICRACQCASLLDLDRRERCRFGCVSAATVPDPVSPLLQTNVTTVRENLPKGDFSIMTEMLKKFLNFMNLTVRFHWRF